MRNALKIIDSTSEHVAWLLVWFCYALVAVIVISVVMRYIFNSPPIWGYETATMLGGSIYAMAYAYTHRHHRHVRVDVVFSHLSPRAKAIIDVTGTLFLFFPFMFFLIRVSADWAWRAWIIGEKSDLTIWYPPMAPFRTAVLIGFSLFFVQAAAQFIRDLYFLVKGKSYD